MPKVTKFFVLTASLLNLISSDIAYSDETEEQSKFRKRFAVERKKLENLVDTKRKLEEKAISSQKRPRRQPGRMPAVLTYTEGKIADLNHEIQKQAEVVRELSELTELENDLNQQTRAAYLMSTMKQLDSNLSEVRASLQQTENEKCNEVRLRRAR